MSSINDGKIGKLQCAFPKLTEANQQYILGVAEGLKYAQGKGGDSANKKPLLVRKDGKREIK